MAVIFTNHESSSPSGDYLHTMDFPKMLDNTKSLADIFEVVKRAVEQDVGHGRGGLMLALADLGNHPQGFIGAFFPVGTNIIVMNKVPLARIKETQPTLYPYYAFHVLLHEFLHSIGFINESQCREKVLQISVGLFGEEHMVTQIARGVEKFFPNLVYPDVAWQPEELSMELVPGFDRGNASYIA
jgi:hypothetical protein